MTGQQSCGINGRVEPNLRDKLGVVQFLNSGHMQNCGLFCIVGDTVESAGRVYFKVFRWAEIF